MIAVSEQRASTRSPSGNEAVFPSLQTRRSRSRREPGQFPSRGDSHPGAVPIPGQFPSQAVPSAHPGQFPVSIPGHFPSRGSSQPLQSPSQGNAHPAGPGPASLCLKCSLTHSEGPGRKGSGGGSEFTAPLLQGFLHIITEWIMLEKPSEIIESNLGPITTVSPRPWH